MEPLYIFRVYPASCYHQMSVPSYSMIRGEDEISPSSLIPFLVPCPQDGQDA